jgi:hypothetical protein
MKKTIENDYLKIEVYGCLCALAIFNIKGIEADLEDFQESHDDEDSENAEDYCCGNKVFRAKKATDELLTKYNITLNQYNFITDTLESELSFGRCGWCS